ncbi:SMP-30/gluconolactonase/LRE family protein [Actinomadura litoris]|uniref:Superoxide dismutase n=1 Tax=Actinomadura litoris TaxID=2678616 RepID=A0A7K1KW66_9ACTN|nr:SMP-30/gluconolactonase/LRE family protein [Actinomadura litoris]MUN36379.1 superoxide dismutase [Actinomadura litoris]
MNRLTRTTAAALALAVLPASASLAAPAGAAPAAAVAPASSRIRVSTAFELPGARVYPEGITLDPRTGDFYVASYEDGSVYKLTRGRRVAEVFLPAGADGRRTANGVRADRAGRLWVCDSSSGVSVYDTKTRRLLARFAVPGTDAKFVNDVAVAPNGDAYITDSARSLVYRVTPRDVAKGGRADLRPRFDLGEAVEQHAPGAFTLNGIVADPSGRYLLTVDMTGGDLYRLDVASGAVRKVALEGGDLRNADGLELQDGRLWAVHNLDNAISRWRIGNGGATARRERRAASAALELPTTLVRSRGTLYVVRSQFDKGGPLGDGVPRIPFSVAAVRGL